MSVEINRGLADTYSDTIRMEMLRVMVLELPRSRFG